MRPEEQRMRSLLGRVSILITLLAMLLVASSVPAFAQTAAEDQYASASSGQYQDGTNGRMPVGPNDPAYPSPPDPESSQTDPSRMPESLDNHEDPGPARSPGAFDQALKDVSANLDSIERSLTASTRSLPSTAGTTGSQSNVTPPAGDVSPTVTVGSASPEAQSAGATINSLSALLLSIIPSTTAIGNPWGSSTAGADQCGSDPGVFCVGGGDPLPPPTVVDQCTPGPGVACIGGSVPPEPSGSFTGGSGSSVGPVPSPIGSLVRQANDNIITGWLVDDPGDSDGDGAVSTDLNPGTYDADPTDHDGDNQVFSDPDGSDPDE